MEKEKRNGDAPLPANLKELLSEAQRLALPGLEYTGWKPWFLRKRMFQTPLLVMHNASDGRTGIMDEAGKISVKDNISIRKSDIAIQDPATKNLHYF
jgi:hypothetical protein